MAPAGPLTWDATRALPSGDSSTSPLRTRATALSDAVVARGQGLLGPHGDLGHGRPPGRPGTRVAVVGEGVAWPVVGCYYCHWVISSGLRRCVVVISAQTGLPLATFLEACPWTLAQILDAHFWLDAEIPSPSC